MKEKTSYGNGIGFPALLTVLFTGLKLTGHIDWSWWWVVSPLWISFAFGLLTLVILLVVAVVADR